MRLVTGTLGTSVLRVMRIHAAGKPMLPSRGRRRLARGTVHGARLRVVRV